MCIKVEAISGLEIVTGAVTKKYKLVAKLQQGHFVNERPIQ